MDDLISRWAAIDALTDTNLKRNVDSLCDGDMNRTRRAAQRVIAQLPAVDAVRIVHGEWMHDGTGAGGYDCSACGKWIDGEIYYMLSPRQLPEYCPYCGAKMDGESDG